MSAFLAEVHVPANDRVVLAQHKSVGVVAAVLARHIGVAAAGGGAHLDDRPGVIPLGHVTVLYENGYH